MRCSDMRADGPCNVLTAPAFADVIETAGAASFQSDAGMRPSSPGGFGL